MSDEKRREDVLYAFAMEPAADRATLERYLQKYPDLAQELIDLSYELQLTEQPALVPVVARTNEKAAEEAWAKFTACQPAKTRQAINPFARFKAAEFAALAAAVKIPRSILVALRDRLVEPATIPIRLLERLAAATKAELEAIRDYLSLPPTIIGTAQFKANSKPSQQGRVSFAQLVKDSQLSDEERKTLVQDLAIDGFE